MKKTFIYVVVMAMLLTGCAGPFAGIGAHGAVKVTPAKVLTPVGTDDPEAFMRGEKNNEWHESYYDRCRVSREFSPYSNELFWRSAELLLGGEENAVCSPLNIYIALSVLAETAGGETQAQILEALGVSDIAKLRSITKALIASNHEDNAAFKSLLAASVWLNDSAAYNQELLNTLAEEYFVSTFSGKPGTEAMDSALREWIDQNTSDLLKNYVSNLKTDPMLVMSIVSTIYYKNIWSEKFNKEKTEKGIFHGKVDQECEMMHKSHYSRYYWGDNFGAITLGLSEGHTALFILPDEGTDVHALLKDDEVRDFVEHLGDYPDSKYLKINMQIPRFRAHSDIKLNDVLKSLGIKDAFNAASADFSPLTDMRDVFLSNAEHAALVSIDEDGVEGTAYTVLGMCVLSMPPEEEIDFVLDRPFYFVIKSMDGSILFAGIVMNISQ